MKNRDKHPEIAELDALAYKIVDKRSKGKCELCEATYGLSKHHLYGRGLSVRWETSGIMNICTNNPNCEFNHVEAEKNRRKFQGMYGTAQLYWMSKQIVYDIDYDAIRERLLKKLEEVEK